MPGRFVGATRITERYLGGQSVKARYRGTTLVWTREAVRDDFEYDGLLMNNGWTDLGSQTDYRLGSVNEKARVDLPDNLLVELHRSAVARWNTLMPKTEGYVEAQVANRGNGGFVPVLNWTYITDVLAWANGSGSATSGAGFRFRESRLFLTSRSGSTTTEVVDCGAFADSDVIRMRRAGQLFTLYRNGRFAGEATLAAVPLGTSNRSITLRADASKDLLGPRRFSASLEYIQAG